tara:strand:+ start:327 stop:1043 length:717 start_codon:yes stop_codon:yes gene_type:complete
MNQLNKEYLNLLLKSGVHTFQNNFPINFFNIHKKNENEREIEQKKDLNKIKNINELLLTLETYDNPLKKTANKLVFYDGNIEAKIMFVGEAPGKEEDESGKPFVGKAGQLLNKMLEAINLNRNEVYITNVIPWRPPNNRTPSEKEIIEFLPFLQKQIEIIKPKYMFLLGVTAAKAILSTPLSLSKLRGKWHNYKSINMINKINVLASYHPAYLLRSPQFKKEAWIDLKMLREKLNNEN